MTAGGFGVILERLVERTPGGLGAVFCDRDGEPIAEFGRGPLLELQIASAQWSVVNAMTEERLRKRGLGSLRLLAVQCDRLQIFVHAIPDRYLLVLSTDAEAPAAKAMAALDRAGIDLQALL